MPNLSEGYHRHVKDQMGELERRRQERLAKAAPQAKLRATDVLAGVSVGWLSEVFHLDPKTVRKRLADCPVKDRVPQGPRYDLAAAAEYLVKPKFDVHKYLKTMKPTDLPQQLQSEYWDMMTTRRNYEEKVGDLWNTSKVQEVFAQVFMTMKSAMQLWGEGLERSTGLSDAQRKALTEQVDALQNEIHKVLIEGKVGEEVRPVISETEVERLFLEEQAESDGSELI